MSKAIRKNHDALRPFDLAAAKAGAPIRWSHLDDPTEFIGTARGSNNEIAVRCPEEGVVEITMARSLRMKELAWFDDTPVYAGDRVYHPESGGDWVTTGVNESGELLCDGITCVISFHNDGLTLAKPAPVKRQGYIIYRPSDVFDSLSEATSLANLQGDRRVQFVEWEE